MAKEQKSLTFIYAVYIRTTPEKLWAALTQGDFSEKYWFGFRIESDWKVGGELKILAPDHMKQYGDVVGKVLAFEPLKKLTYTFGPPDLPKVAKKRKSPSRVTYELKPMGALVKLRLVHDNLLLEDIKQNPDTFEGVNNGWPAILSSLKSLLETGQALVFQI